MHGLYVNDIVWHFVYNNTFPSHLQKFTKILAIEIALFNLLMLGQ